MTNLQEVRDLIKNCNPMLLGSFSIATGKLVVYKDSDILVSIINSSGKFPKCHYDINTRTIQFQ